MRAGEPVRLDVGYEWKHCQRDLGRTVPVSGHCSDDQCETWNIFVAACRAGAAVQRSGIAVDQVYEVWRSELLRQRAAAKSTLAQHAIDSRSKRENVRFWQIGSVPHGSSATHTVTIQNISSASFPPHALL